jgi:FMN phosphatase YigB (HAD superfamily)
MGIIGVDFDNTIVRYDELFHRLALERSLIPPSVTISKTAVRDYLRSQDREADWIALQGLVYGPRLKEAEAFPGVLDFFRRCRELKIPTCIISHKTHLPASGESHDLHGAARAWLETCGFLGTMTGLTQDKVFFEESRSAKLQRIAAENCVVFIDDLPECLTEPAFPLGVERILFDPANAIGLGPYQLCGSWQEIGEFVFAALERR